MWKRIFGAGRRKEAEESLAERVQRLGTEEQERLPKHVAIIMDGNGRWAKKRGLPRFAGHKAGVDALHDILDTARLMPIKALTAYSFSTENWRRPRKEVDFLMRLFVDYLDKEMAEMHAKNIRIHFIGRVEELPALLIQKAHEAEKLMKDNDGIQFNVAVNYGGQDELARATQEIAETVRKGELKPEAITPETIAAHLDTRGLPPVDLLIRTGGEMRISNFLLWQAAYAEFWFTKINWPAFTPENFLDALEDFMGRSRRFGGLKN